MEISLEDYLVVELKDVLSQLLNKPPSISAFGGWTDASLISNFAHIPTVVFGPGDLSVAHSPCEYIPVEELRLGTMAYAMLAAACCNLPK
jgi:acetylornithine deacetylase/succinyl-diaminopimelate desuccinylase